MTNAKSQRKDVPSDLEINKMLEAADQIETPFLRLRAKATVGFLETGKRRSEIASLLLEDIWTDADFLYVRFTVRKKRKKNITALQRTKKFRLDSVFAKSILEYVGYIREHYPDCRFVYPSGRMLFGIAYIVDVHNQLKAQEIWRIVKWLNPDDWPHLHRELRAVRVIRSDEFRFGEAKLETVYRIKKVLDLENEGTAWNYIRRHEVQSVEEEEEAV